MTLLLPMVEEALDRAGISIDDVEAVAVGRGPGSYTGVRIGMAAAKGLAQGLGVPLAGFGTLDAVAFNFTGRVEGLVGVVGDAMRGEVYPALFSLEGPHPRRLTPDTVADPNHVASQWSRSTEAPVLLAGDGLAKHADVFLERLGERARVAGEQLWLPRGGSCLACVAALGEQAFKQPGAVLPVYTRLADAEHAEGRAGVPESGVAGPPEEAGWSS